MNIQNRFARSVSACRNGAVLVEFAFVLPILMLFFGGMIEISRVLLLQHTADTAAYEGARNAMVPGATSEEAYAVTKSLLDAAGLKGATITISPSLITEDTPVVSVLVDVPIAQNAWIFPRFFNQMSISSDISLLAERSPLIQLTGVPVLKSKGVKVKVNVPLL